MNELEIVERIGAIGTAGGTITILGFVYLIVKEIMRSRSNGKCTQPASPTGSNSDLKAHARLDDFIGECNIKHQKLEREMGENSQRFINIESTLKEHSGKLDKILVAVNGKSD